MRIKVINPIKNQSMREKTYDTATSVARPNTEIVAVSPKNRPACIDNIHSHFSAVTGLMEEVHKGVKMGFDGFIAATACDHGLYAVRQIAKVPVMSIGEASMYMENMVAANNFYNHSDKNHHTFALRGC